MGVKTSRRRHRLPLRPVIVVDDNVERVELFLTRLGARTVVARSYTEAVAAFRSHRFERAFLDFDFGGGMNGADVAYWLARNLPVSDRPRVVIHSTNPGGALSIQVTLDGRFDVEVQPFPPRCLEEDFDGK